MKRIAAFGTKRIAAFAVVTGVIRSALGSRVGAHGRKRLSFLGIGTSGRADISERHEEMLWRETATLRKRET